MHQQLPHEEVHALHVVRLVVVAGERPENAPQLLEALLVGLEVFVLGEGTVEVPVYLLG